MATILFTQEVSQLSVEIKKPIRKPNPPSQLLRKSIIRHPVRKISIKQKRKKDSVGEKSFEQIPDEFRCQNPNCTNKNCETRSNGEKHSSMHRSMSYKISIGNRRSNANKCK